jgi:hypothetical protein
MELFATKVAPAVRKFGAKQKADERVRWNRQAAGFSESQISSCSGQMFYEFQMLNIQW